MLDGRMNNSLKPPYQQHAAMADDEARLGISSQRSSVRSNVLLTSVIGGQNLTCSLKKQTAPQTREAPFCLQPPASLSVSSTSCCASRGSIMNGRVRLRQ